MLACFRYLRPATAPPFFIGVVLGLVPIGYCPSFHYANEQWAVIAQLADPS
ncbi:MAG: hypothetical protein AAF823_06915 [Planctomycetota bacterium]